MTALAQLCNRVRALLEAFAWLPPLVARIVVGWVFVESGWGKLHHIDKVAGFFTSLSLPAPAFQAHLVATTEFAGGLALLLGLCTRLASIPLMIIMFVAIATAKKDDLHGFSDLIGFPEFLYMALLFWLLIAGPGKAAVDAFLAARMRRQD